MPSNQKGDELESLEESTMEDLKVKGGQESFKSRVTIYSNLPLNVSSFLPRVVSQLG